MKLNTAFTLFTLFFRDYLGSRSNLLQRMIVDARAMLCHTRGTKINLTTAAMIRLLKNVLFAMRAGWNELGRVGIVQMVQNHHTGMLRAAQLVELVVVSLTQI